MTIGRVALHSNLDGTPPAPGAPPPGGAVVARSPASMPETQQAHRRLAAAVGRHADLVWRSLRRFGVPERDVADAAQQVFLTFFQCASDIEGGKEPAYLVSVAVRVAANARRKLQRSREDALGDEVLTAHPARHTPEDLVGEKQLREELDRGLLSLPFEQRTVFVLYELEGFTLPEIGEALGIPLGTATSRLRRARAHFEAWVESRAGE
ncbi:MAG TPA: sigma-70 family RNA polymerase sigma factor [Polyangiaceae bacterium]|nr:sigma-70 family RNA polymerase sigma factor [Polyangiaceae bacterium]